MNNKLRANWKVYRKTMTVADTQYSQAISPDALFVSVSTTDMVAEFKVSVIADQVVAPGTQYRTIPSGAIWEIGTPILGTKTIYLASGTAGIVIEIEEWT